MKTASHSDHPLKRTWQILCITFLTFLLFNAICIGICTSWVDLICKRPYLAFECSDLAEVFSFAFAVMWTTILDKNKNFEIFDQKHVV